MSIQLKLLGRQWWSLLPAPGLLVPLAGVIARAWAHLSFGGGDDGGSAAAVRHEARDEVVLNCVAAVVVAAAATTTSSTSFFEDIPPTKFERTPLPTLLTCPNLAFAASTANAAEEE